MDDDVSRYSVCDREDDPFMERCEDGDWVNFADYARLKARVAAADKLAAKCAALAQDAYGYEHLYETPFHCTVYETLQPALAAYQATKEQSE